MALGNGLGNFDVGTITAAPSGTSVFGSWSGQSAGVTGCTSTAPASCNFSLGNNTQTVTVTFTAGANTAPNAPTSLAQFRADGTTSIATGGFANTTTVVLKGSVSDPNAGNTLKLQVEVKPVGTAFDGITGLFTESSLGANPHTGSVTVTGLSDGVSYHWQARTIDNNSAVSSVSTPWTSFGGNAENAADFIVDATAPTISFTNPTGATSQSSTSVGVTWTETDTGSGINAATRSIQRQSGAPVSNSCASATFTNNGAATSAASPRNDSGLSNNTCYRWLANISDNAGNAATQAVSARC